MLSFSGIQNSDLDKINEIRKQSHEVKSIRKLGLAPEKVKFSFPHETYNLGLSALMKSGDPKLTLTGLRVIETGDNNFNFIYDINKNTEEQGMQMFKDKNFIKAYENAFEMLTKADDANDDYTVRTLKVPALYIDALWLHNEKNDLDDKFLPVRSMSLFEDNQFYDKKKFFSILQDAAKDLDKDDELLGG